MSTPPHVADTSGGNRTTDATSHVANLPANIASGNLLIMLAAWDGNPTVTWPAGWSALHAGVVNGSGARVEARYRIADGTEGASITITTNNSEQFAYTGLRITDRQGNPESSGGAVGTSTQPNPDTLTPSWGSDDTLWLACGAYDGGQTFLQNQQIGAGGIHRTGGTGGAGGANPNQRADNSNGIGVVAFSTIERTASFDPSSPILSGSVPWRAFTIGVRPAAAAASGGVRTFGFAG